jgi:hypothetical protein
MAHFNFLTGFARLLLVNGQTGTIDGIANLCSWQFSSLHLTSSSLPLAYHPALPVDPRSCCERKSRA